MLTGVDLGADELERDAPADHVPERVEVAGQRLLEVLLVLPAHRERGPYQHLLGPPALRRALPGPGPGRREPRQVLADGRHHLEPRPPLPLLRRRRAVVERREAEVVRAPAARHRRPRRGWPPAEARELPAWRGHASCRLLRLRAWDLRFWLRSLRRDGS